jgi:Zn-dependent M32 family carboxypeptidase
MTPQSETPNWSGAVQRELDAVQRNTELRFTDFANRLDKLLTLTEYYADKRLSETRFDNLHEKVEDSEHDIDSLRTELRNSIESLRRDILAERTRSETALNAEKQERKTEQAEYVSARKELFRWVVSMIMIPIALALVSLLVKK